MNMETEMDLYALAAWRGYVETRDRALLWNALHPDVVFESPIAHTPQRGRETAIKYLIGAAEVLGGPGFRFVEAWRNERGAVLELATEIDGVEINGVDIITVDEAGLITNFKVMVRPLEAIRLLHRLMGAQLEKSEPLYLERD